MPTNITFLLGAGASVPAGIPHVQRFYDDFRLHLAGQFGKGHELFSCHERIEEFWGKVHGTALRDLERLYETLTFLNGDPVARSIPLCLPTGFPSRSREVELLEWELKKYVQQRCLAVRAKELGYLRPLGDFLKLSQPLAVLSLNYDPCVEIILDEIGISWTDGGPAGSDEFFASRLSFPVETDVHLIKLHGSATWYHTRLEREPGWVRRVRGVGQLGVSRRLGAARTLTHEAMMIYPTLNKALTNGPFPALTLAAQTALAESGLCLAVGYSFADVHVRRLVLEAMSLNPRLRLVLVNPYPRSILEVLYRDAGAGLSDRIGIASPRSREFGFVEKALAGDWLLRQAEAWLKGAPIQLPFSSSRGRIGGPQTRLRSPSRWRLRYPIVGGVGGLARGEGVLYMTLGNRRDVCELDLKTGSLRTLCGGFESLRGLAFDSTGRVLYVVSNKYRSWPRSAPWSRGGIGQIWVVNVDTGVKHALTRIDWGRTGIGILRHRLRGGEEAYWKRLVGGLRWPNSVVVEEPGRSLLFTEAKSVSRLDLRTSRLSTAVEIPMGFNVVDLSLAGADSVLIADAGVHPRGFGRLMRSALSAGSLEVLAGGWSGIGSLAYLPSRRLVLLSQIGPWPRGRVFSVNLDAPDDPPKFSWQGLDQPSHLCVGTDDADVLIATREGLVDLRLD